MAMDKEQMDNAADLRKTAEEQVAVQAAAHESQSDQDVKRLYHELQIHQVELEMQNTELLLTKHDLEATRDSYLDLYDLAPIGYLTINIDGLIQKANLTAATMLGWTRNDLVNNPIQKFIFRDDIDAYYLQSRSAIEASEKLHLELRFVRADSSPFWVNLQAFPQNDDELWIALTDIGDSKQLEQSLRQANETLEEQVEELSTAVASSQKEIAGRKWTEEERLGHLRFLESMDKVNRAIQGANDLETMMSDVLDAMLSIFACDRAYLMYPCDPEAESWVIPMERTTPDYPGAKLLGVDISIDARVAGKLRLLLSTDGPVNMGYGTPHMLSGTTAENFGIRSMMAMAIYPKVGKPWEFGIHHCSCDRLWTPEEERLLKEIGRRLEVALTSLLTHRDLQESEERYRRIVDTATEGIWVVGPDTMTSFVNARMAEMLGCSGEEMIGRLFTDFMFEEDVPDQLQKMENRRKGISETYERRFYRNDGQTVWTHASTTPIFDAEHHFKGSFGMFTDITERKRMENVLRESEERFRTLTEKSFVGVYIIQDDLFRYVNPAFVEIFGYKPEEIVDILGPIDCITTEDRERVLDSIRHRMAGEIEFSHHEFHISRKDGSIRVVETFGSRASHHGRPAIIGTIIDITERKRAEDNLFQATERWGRTFDAVPDLIAIIDTNFRVVQVNKAMSDRLGATPAECAGQYCYAAVHKSEAPPSFCPHAQTLTDCREHMCEVREEGLGGDFIVSTSPIYDSAGQLMGSVHVARDITKRKHAETKLNEQLHFLQQLLDSIPIPVYYKDVDGLYLGCNLAFERFIGLSRKVVVGKTVYEVVPKERADKHHESDSALLRQPGVQIYEVSGIYNDGECHNVIFTKATFVDANNRVGVTPTFMQ